MSIITPSTFDIKKLSMSEVKKLENSPSSLAYLNYNGGKLRIQVPQMPIPYDSGDYKDNGKFKAQLSFRDRASNPKVQKYYDMLQAIDNFVVDHATKNAGKWFRTPGASKEMVARDYTTSTRISKDKEGNPKDYPPTQSVALKKARGSGSFETALYDDKKRRLEGVLPTDVLRKGAEISSIVDCGGVWIVGTKFGLNWKLTQARIDVAAEGADAGCVIADDDEVDDEEIAAAPKATKATPAAEEEEEAEEEAEEDEGEVVEPVPVPPPVKAAPKKVVKKVAKA
jgi:hypothetical protein